MAANFKNLSKSLGFIICIIILYLTLPLIVKLFADLIYEKTTTMIIVYTVLGFFIIPFVYSKTILLLRPLIKNGTILLNVVSIISWVFRTLYFGLLLLSYFVLDDKRHLIMYISSFIIFFATSNAFNNAIVANVLEKDDEAYL